ncbi:MAG: sugar phosphate isomerase/epimerase [Acidobacteria bacterium]|nr:MAG: sugar phosphate isomerase/epimerase [Acidobacteriota bacterium]
MKFGVNALIWTANFDAACLPLLPIIKEKGFDGVELPAFEPTGMPVAEIRRALTENDLECTVCSVLTGDLSLITHDATIRKKALTRIADFVRLASDLGASIVAGPLYSPVGLLMGRRRTRDEWNRAVDAYRSLGPVLEQNGVTLAIEPLNRFETYFLNTASDAAQLCDEVDHPNVGILLDTFHANIEEKDLYAACLTAGSRLRHVHTSENDRGTPGRGHIDWHGLFSALREIGYDGWLTIESFGFGIVGVSAAAAIWRDIEPTPESIAFDGVKFLKKTAAGIR